MDEEEGGEVIGLPLGFETVGGELVGDCHDLHRGFVSVGIISDEGYVMA